MSLFYNDLFKDENKAKLDNFIAFAAVANMSNIQYNRNLEEPLLFDKGLFVAVAKKYDMDLEISDEEYKGVYEYIQNKVDENNEELSDILANWLNDDKTEKIMQELEEEFEIPLLGDMDDFIQAATNGFEDQASNEKDEEMESKKRQAQAREALERYQHAREFVDSLTTQEAVDGRVAQYFEKGEEENKFLKQYWALAKYQLSHTENTSEYVKMKQSVTDFLGKRMIPNLVNDIMSNHISDSLIEDLVGAEAGRDDRARLQKEIEAELQAHFNEALEHVSFEGHPIRENQEYDGLLKFISNYSSGTKDPVAQSIEVFQVEQTWGQRERNAKAQLEELIQRKEEQIDHVLSSPGSEDIRQYIRNTKYLEEEERRKLQENGGTQEQQEEFENFKDQLNQSSADLVMSRMKESIKIGISNLDLVGMARSQDQEVIDNLRKQIQSDVEKHIYDKIVSAIQKMEIQPEKPSNFKSSEPEAKDVDHPQRSEVQNQEEKLRDVVEKNVNQDAGNKVEEPKKEEEPKAEEERKKEEEPKAEEGPKKEEEPKAEEEPKKAEEPKPEEERKKEEESKKEEPQKGDVSTEELLEGEELEEQAPIDSEFRMVDLDTVEMNRNLHSLLEELQDADPFYIRSSPEFRNMKRILTTMVRGLDNRGDFLDSDGLRELTEGMKELQTCTRKYLAMKHKEKKPSNNALRRMAVADKILNAANKYVGPLSAIFRGDKVEVVKDTDQLREALQQSRRKEAQEVDKMPEGLGKDVAKKALLARERLEQYACSKVALSEREQKDARECFHFLISNRLVQMQIKKQDRLNLKEAVPKIISGVSQMEAFNVDRYIKDPKSIAEFLNNHMENKMIKESIAAISQRLDSHEQVKEQGHSQLNQKENVNKNDKVL
ncbi:MAG: hypothetical protein ACI4FX_12680 [Agathobacter sp.]